MNGKILLLFAVAAVCSAVPTVDELEVEAYLGRWYQVYGNAVGWINNGPDAVCVVADYYNFDGSKFEVRNFNRVKNPDGDLDEISGNVYPTEDPGKLEVQFTSRPIPGRAPYWVMKLGPKNAEGLYDYSLVSDPLGAFLFVLTRDVATFDEKYKDEVLEFVAENGFDLDINKPIRIPQPDDCQYLDFPGYY